MPTLFLDQRSWNTNTPSRCPNNWCRLFCIQQQTTFTGNILILYVLICHKTSGNLMIRNWCLNPLVHSGFKLRWLLKHSDRTSHLKNSPSACHLLHLSAIFNSWSNCNYYNHWELEPNLRLITLQDICIYVTLDLSRYKVYIPTRLFSKFFNFLTVNHPRSRPHTHVADPGQNFHNLLRSHYSICGHTAASNLPVCSNICIGVVRGLTGVILKDISDGDHMGFPVKLSE